MTQLENAKRGCITEEMRVVAAAERLDPERVREAVRDGVMVIPRNLAKRATRLSAIGGSSRIKVNANIGTSRDYPAIDSERAKLRAAVEAGADAVMDLSTGGDLRAVRRVLAEEANLVMGSVPIYEAAVNAAARGGLLSMTADEMLDALRTHARDGMDFVTVHCGVTRDVAAVLAATERVCGVVSRGGTFLVEWMARSGQENPYYERFDEVLDVVREFDVTLSLGDGMRPGAIADAMDRPQIEELFVLADLARRARARDVQVMIEGPGHVPLDQIPAQVKLAKEVCDGAPLYVLGPIVTDVAPGYDHITSAIGGAVAALAGADFLCYVTPTEHLSLPGPDAVREGVIAARIAAHAADVARGVPGAREWDAELSRRRRARDWNGQIGLCIDPARAASVRRAGPPTDEETCSMCGEYCVFKIHR
ncbi:MAG: phosphomethylpyrimidine synthase ThiC [Planctomycetota bacterium]